MGWLWSIPPPSSTSSTQEEKFFTSSEFTQQRAQAVKTTTSSSKPLTGDELDDRELQSFLQELEDDTRSSVPIYNHVPRKQRLLPSTSNTAINDGSPKADQLEPLAEQLLPKTMSCRHAFDSAFYCNSFGGQFNNLYRYGTIRSCSENWSDFWFCMRTRSYATTEKEEMIRQRYRSKERVRYGRDEMGKSSEDIWKSREKKMEWGDAFNVPVPVFEGDDDEWNRIERTRREKKGIRALAEVKN